MCAGWGQIKFLPKNVLARERLRCCFSRTYEKNGGVRGDGDEKEAGEKQRTAQTGVLHERLHTARAKKNKGRARFGIWFQLRGMAGNTGFLGGGVQIPKSPLLKTPLLRPLMVALSFSFVPILPRPRQSKLGLEGITFHTCIVSPRHQVKGNKNQVPYVKGRSL